jgi:hypothetical protein
MQLAAQALRSSNSMKELSDNLLKAGVTWLSQFAENTIGGQFGGLAGGLVQFAGNLLFNKDEPLPVHDGALDVRIINWQDDQRDLAAVRDSSQLAARVSRRRDFSLAFAAQGGI